ncbi:Uma2 family endonuclease [Streptomyces thermocarboxydovorans]|uniref:Uma2 family endonuclease n=1 Tax=Streptomyces thermocarboxydovorans TaxID=59298 RepID=A0ABP3SQ63_9ACTN
MTVMTERPTTGGTEPRSGFEELLDLLDQLHVPDGYRAEIVSGSIVVSPWSKGSYLRVLRQVCEQLEPHVPEGHVVERGPFLFVFPGDECAYGPDIHVAHERVFETESNRLDGEGLFFVAELTSPATRSDDLTNKVGVYARGGVPVYLILDMQKQQAIVYGSPSPQGTYEVRFTKPFGEKLPMPAPLDFLLDTTGFQAP